MAKQRRTLDERIQSCTTKEEEMLEKLKQCQVQRKWTIVNRMDTILCDFFWERRLSAAPSITFLFHLE